MQSAHDVVLDTVDALRTQGTGLAAYYHEYGPGQQELVVDHETGVAAPDNHVRFTQTVRAVAADHGLDATFRPKPFPTLPGSGCHVHCSLWRDGENVLHDPDADGPYLLSAEGQPFVAGLLDHAPALVALTAPTVESYDRLAPGTWASAFHLLGARQPRGRRPGAVREPDGPRRDDPRRVQARRQHGQPVPRPARLVAAGLDGIERGLDPGEPLNRDPSGLDEDERLARGVERLPTTLAEALDAPAADDVLAEALGDPLHGSYLEVKRSEWAQSTEDGEPESGYLDRAF